MPRRARACPRARLGTTPSSAVAPSTCTMPFSPPMPIRQTGIAAMLSESMDRRPVTTEVTPLRCGAELPATPNDSCSLLRRERLHDGECRAGRILQHAEAADAGDVLGPHADLCAKLLGARDRRVGI